MRPPPPARATAKQQRGQAVVDKVLRAAAQELLRAEAQPPSIEAIAARSGVNKTTIYRRWRTLPALLLEASSVLFAELAPPADTGSLEGDLVHYFLGISALIGASSPSRVVRGPLPRAANEELDAVYLELKKRKMSELRTLFKRAVRRNEIADTSHATLVGEVVGGAIVHLEVSEGVRCTPARVRSIVSLVLRGVPGFEPR